MLGWESMTITIVTVTILNLQFQTGVHPSAMIAIGSELTVDSDGLKE